MQRDKNTKDSLALNVPQNRKSKGVIVDSDDEDVLIKPNSIEQKPDEATVKVNKTKKPKTEPVVKKKKVVEEDYEKTAYDLINKMKSYYNTDLELNKQNKPSLQKIENIEDICSKIMKKESQEIFIRMGILSELKTWLEPLPDNSLPNPKIKKYLLDLLYSMKITKSDLMNCGIGKIVHFYSKNTKESLDVRKMATRVIKKWKHRIIREEMI